MNFKQTLIVDHNLRMCTK